MEGGAAVSIEDDFAAFRRVAGEEIAKLREENASLRAHAERVGEANDRLVVENGALHAKIAELEHLLSPKP
jgi:phage shock protein A